MIYNFQQEKVSRWFSDNQMKGNTDKCHLIMSTNNTPKLKVGDSLIKTSTCEKLLGVEIDCKLTFDNHVANLCKKANNKLRARASQLDYCPFTWMLHTHCKSNKIKHLHERCLRVIYCDKNSSYSSARTRWVSLYPPQKYKKILQ